VRTLHEEQLGEPRTTMICGYFHLARPPRSGVLELLPRVLRLEQAANAEWLEAICDAWSSNRPTTVPVSRLCSRA
jgi:Cupin